MSKGLGKNTHGDVNLWGYKKSPNLQEITEEMNRNISFMNDMRNVKEYNEMDKLLKMKTLLRMASCKIRSVREAQVSERRLEKYEKASTSPSSYEYLKSAARTYIYDCKIFIKSMLTLNQKICEYMNGKWQSKCD